MEYSSAVTETHGERFVREPINVLAVPLGIEEITNAGLLASVHGTEGHPFDVAGWGNEYCGGFPDTVDRLTERLERAAALTSAGTGREVVILTIPDEEINGGARWLIAAERPKIDAENGTLTDVDTCRGTIIEIANRHLAGEEPFFQFLDQV
jgi:hypothetical protein